MGKGKKWNEVPPSQQSPLDAAVASRDAGVIQMVKEAVKHKQVALAYQPVVQTTRPSQPAFYEGLIRLFDETGRIIPARDFIDQIEEIELGRQIDCLALEKGLRALRETPHIRLSINMSARSIGYTRWMDTLKRGLRADPTVGERLILEITERSAMTVPELVVSFMSDLQRKGISFALDDFGSGYTSFRYLRDFYFDILKIDGEFIRNIHTDPDNQVLTKAMVAIAQQFDMFTVAESVESFADVKWLQQIGVDCLQGYYFGAPTIQPPWKQKPEDQSRQRA
ncbi:MAG: EAL domain-containing protein [Thalassovita sp.]